ncbi:hypothetical protein [Pseudoalteromonas viridis]|uniref:Uncharacterized protein n=1 Tax=Pseudoalteromonas viridis TaxID=339617 RepID=A0ABX7V1E1_9GAMM|nr:hypothetical protein [Pseudoalteromonas viridis]QTL34686.1 hypothetical protein J5X90_14230 [Pseudoalteromonas viridis]
MTENVEQNKKMNPIAVAISTFTHAIRDAEEVIKFYVPVAARMHNKRVDELKKKGEEAKALSEKDDLQSQVLGSKCYLEVVRSFERLSNSNVPETIKKALFLNLFSSFDAFIGDLISCLFNSNPELYKGLGKQICVSDILSFENFDELKEKVLSDEIETIRRKSYVEQFSDLERLFAIPLTKFKNWPDFVELSQRRNLLMHCNGVVSEQYLRVCKREGYNFKKEVTIGQELTLGTEYMEMSFDLMVEVAVKLGQTLWRKAQPSELEQADDHLSDTIYDYLHEKEYKKAICLGEFSMSLPKVSSDLMSKINIINLVIAYKMSGENEKSQSVLKSIDWTASINDFKLASAVLSDDFDSAKELMLKIKGDGEMITESSYHNFPLFSEFRESEQFLTGYKEVFGYSFASELIRKSEGKESDGDENSTGLTDETISEEDLVKDAEVESA